MPAVKERESLGFEDVALRFGIGGKNTAFRWTKQPGPCKTRNKLATKIDMDALARDVGLHPNACQNERAGRTWCQ